MKLLRGWILTTIIALAGFVALQFCVVGQWTAIVSWAQFCGDWLLQETYPTCGNNKIDGWEWCDNWSENGVACSSWYGQTCTYCSPECDVVTLKWPTCWDWVVNWWEKCDDWNTDNTDSCTNNCQIISCWDGLVQWLEQCDTWVDNWTVCVPWTWTCSYCSSTCTKVSVQWARCGDGNVDEWEECDDSNQSNADECTNSCKIATCGDWIKNNWEQCDVWPSNWTQCVPGNWSCTFCGESCTFVELVWPKCGDGNVDEWEECDDWNKDNTDTCTATCKLAVCGDWDVNNAEQCDNWSLNGKECDPWTTSCSYCSSSCEEVKLIWKRCGDSKVDEWEECDDGNGLNNDACTNLCKKAVCGDSQINNGESCDSWANNGAVCNPWNWSCTYCSSTCDLVDVIAPKCGDNNIDSGEECDDWNLSDSDWCLSTCKKPVCGDSIVSLTEECDSWANNGKVCSPTDTSCTYCSTSCNEITLQPIVCWNWKIETWESCDDGNLEDGDWCTFACKIEPSVLLDTGWWPTPLSLPRPIVSVPSFFWGANPIVLPAILPSTWPINGAWYGPLVRSFSF